MKNLKNKKPNFIKILRKLGLKLRNRLLNLAGFNAYYKNLILNFIKNLADFSYFI